MYNDEYNGVNIENDEDEELKVSNNFIVNFYNNNKILVWIFGGIIIFILLMSLLTKGGKSSTPTIEYSVKLYPEGDAYVNIGRSTNLIASVKNNPRAKIVWSVEDENIVSVSNGNIVGLNYGKTTVTATYIDSTNQKYSDTKNVIVADGDPSVTLVDAAFKQGDLFMPTNSKYQVALVLTPTRGFVESETFTSSNESVVTVDNKGMVTSVGEGEAIITADVNDGKFKKELKVHVNKNYGTPEIVTVPTMLSFDGELRKIEVGSSERLAYVINPPTANIDQLIWASSDETVATVENGVVTGVKEGTAIVTVSSVTGVNDKINIEVVNSVVEVTSIDLSERQIEVEVGNTREIQPTVNPSNAGNKALSYTSLDEYVAFVNPSDTGTSATIMGISEGVTTIIIESNNGIKEQLTVTVTDPFGQSDEWEDFDPYDWGSYDFESGYIGGGSGGSSGGSSKKKGFSISSIDAKSSGHIVDSEGSASEGNAAIAPVLVTVTKTDSEIKKLEIAYNDGFRITEDTVSFILNRTDTYTIVVTQVYSDGSTKSFNKYINVINNDENNYSHIPCVMRTNVNDCIKDNKCAWDYTNYCHDKNSNPGTTPINVGNCKNGTLNKNQSCTVPSGMTCNGKTAGQQYTCSSKSCTISCSHVKVDKGDCSKQTTLTKNQYCTVPNGMTCNGKKAGEQYNCNDASCQITCSVVQEHKGYCTNSVLTKNQYCIVPSGKKCDKDNTNKSTYLAAGRKILCTNNRCVIYCDSTNVKPVIKCTENTVKIGSTRTCSVSGGTIDTVTVNDKVVLVNHYGSQFTIKGVKAGTASIIVRVKGSTEPGLASITVISATPSSTPTPTVSNNPNAVITCTSNKVYPGTIKECTAVNGTITSVSIDDSSIATISDWNGSRVIVKGKAAGNTILRILVSGQRKSIPIAVNSADQKACHLMTTVSECTARSDCKWDYSYGCTKK